MKLAEDWMREGGRLEEIQSEERGACSPWGLGDHTIKQREQGRERTIQKRREPGTYSSEGLGIVLGTSGDAREVGGKRERERARERERCLLYLGFWGPHHKGERARERKDGIKEREKGREPGTYSIEGLGIVLGTAGDAGGRGGKIERERERGACST